MASARLERPIHRPSGTPKSAPMAIESRMRPRLTMNSGAILPMLSASAGSVAAGVGSAGEPMSAAHTHHKTMTKTVPHTYPKTLRMTCLLVLVDM